MISAEYLERRNDKKGCLGLTYYWACLCEIIESDVVVSFGVLFVGLYGECSAYDLHKAKKTSYWISDELAIWKA